MQDTILYLNLEDIQKLKEIGKGTDGTVYLYKKEYLLKIYHKNIQYILNSRNDEEVKIYQKGKTIENKMSNLIYYDYRSDEPNEVIRTLLAKDAISKIVEHQKNIQYTTLPLKAVYINGIFVGCILLRQRGIMVHKLIGMPLHYKRKIFETVLRNEEELLKNCVYHLDLANSPFHMSLNSSLGHSHILVNPFNLDTNFIDLDGHSTVYTSVENEYYLYRSMENLNILTMEFLLKIEPDLLNNIEENIDEIAKEIEECGIHSTLTEKLIHLKANLNDLYSLNRSLKR